MVVDGIEIPEKVLVDPVYMNDRLWIPPRGNTEAKIMIVLSHPNAEDLQQRYLCAGSGASVEIRNALEANQISEDDVWITSMVKYGIGSKTKPSSDQIAECAPYLDAEIEFVKPKLIMALGAEAFKRIMKTNIKISDYLGEIIDCPYGCKILANHSAGTILAQDPTKRPQFVENFTLAKDFVTDNLHYTPFKYYVVNDPEENKKILQHYMDKGMWTIGYDGEWLGDRMENDVMHTFQYCCEPGMAFILNISEDGKTENKELLDTMKMFLEHPKADRLGWNIRADDKRLKLRGFELSDETLGFDGMKGVAFFDSRWGKGLETGIKYFTNYPPYYTEFFKALKDHKIDKAEMCKLKFINPTLFYYYCAGDAVSHYEACKTMREHFPEKHREYYFGTYLPLSNYFLDLEVSGIPIDVEVLKEITDQYKSKYEELKTALHQKLEGVWVSEDGEPFNPNSAPQKKKLLFEIMKLTPAYYTKGGKSPKPRSWYEKQKPQSQRFYSPSTNGKSLATMVFDLAKKKDTDPAAAQKYDIIKNLLDLGRVGVFANKFLSTRGVSMDEFGGIEEYEDFEGEIEPTAADDDSKETPLKQSYWAALCSDGRIHADFYECLDNYRSSSRVNVQNPASKVLSHIPEIFVPGYSALSKEEQKAVGHLIPKNIRNIFCAGHKDWAWAEVDVAGADLAIMAFLSKDPNFIYDIRKGGFHVTKMREYFQDPTLGKNDASKYVIAKSITFRISYTSGLKSAALPIQADIYAENGLAVDLKLIEYALNTWYRYDTYMAYRDQCTLQVETGSQIKNAREMVLQFEETDNFSIKAGWCNQSLAFPIASELALFMWDVSVQIRKELKKAGLWNKYIYPVNSVHDASYWIHHKDLLKDNYLPEVCRYYFTKGCKIASGDNLGCEMVVADRWKGKEKLFSAETVWDFEQKEWKWDH